MWSETTDRVFRNLRGELTACRAESEESDVLVQFLKCDWDVPAEELQFPIAIQA